MPSTPTLPAQTRISLKLGRRPKSSLFNSMRSSMMSDTSTLVAMPMTDKKGSKVIDPEDLIDFEDQAWGAPPSTAIIPQWSRALFSRRKDM
ncbi:hypothetical protein AX17_000740 [Amanita inopinata Kibby_2008]|nr:hypothetical protein AX17_000740 [Amanita inopinata Kibby_2008]